MRRPLVGLLLTLSVGCAKVAPETTHRGLVPGVQLSEDRTLQAELRVARELLQQAATGEVIVDSMYAIPGQAPGSPSEEMRPASRTQMLRDSLNVNRGSGQAVILRLSKPELVDNWVRITATIDYPMAAQPGRRGYHTVEYTLEGGAPAWTIRTRVQLGVT